MSDSTVDPASLQHTRRFTAFTISRFDGIAWTPVASRLNHYGDDSDNPRWIVDDVGTGTLTRLVPGPDGDLAATTTGSGSPLFQVVNLHGDVTTTLDATLLPPGFDSYDGFGVPDIGQQSRRYGWLGSNQRSAGAIGGVMLMGVRLYHPDTGRFTSVDPVPGGSATVYDYANQDPQNVFDLDGRAPGGCWMPRYPTPQQRRAYQECLSNWRAFSKDPRAANDIRACFRGMIIGVPARIAGGLFANVVRWLYKIRYAAVLAGWPGLVATLVITCIVGAVFK